MGSRIRLRLVDLRLPIHLGCTLAEQEIPQEVSFSFEICFSEMPGACRTDRLEDTVCYGRLSEVVRTYCAGRRFQTVEKLAHECYETLKPEMIPTASLSLSVHKLKPPVDSLKGGVFFEIENQP